MSLKRNLVTLAAAMVVGTAVVTPAADAAEVPSRVHAAVTSVYLRSSAGDIWTRAKKACKQWLTWRWPRMASGRNQVLNVPGTDQWMAGGERRNWNPPSYGYGMNPVAYDRVGNDALVWPSPFTAGEAHLSVVQERIEPSPSYLDALMTDPEDDWVIPRPPYVSVWQGGRFVGNTDCG